MSARLEKLLLRALVARPATISGPASDDKAAQGLAKTLGDTTRRVLGRALSIREVDAGSCNGCELEIHALNNPVYDLERFGLKFVASPRHADVLLVTGPVTANMKTALERTYNATPAPKWVVALGDCACTGGLFKGSYACIGAVEDVVPVDLRIPGCPPRPVEILGSLVALIETASRSGKRR
jgi:Ni,Fe-hydrogenase III small subunit